MTIYQDITLVSGSTTITLPADMEWTDRRARNLVAQNIEISAGGSQIIEEFQQIGGYPITLVSGDTVWINQSVIDALITLADTPLASPMTLTFNDGTSMSVRFRYTNGSPAVDATPIYDELPRENTHPYALTLRLFQASA